MDQNFQKSWCLVAIQRMVVIPAQIILQLVDGTEVDIVHSLENHTIQLRLSLHLFDADDVLIRIEAQFDTLGQNGMPDSGIGTIHQNTVGYDEFQCLRIQFQLEVTLVQIVEQLQSLRKEPLPPSPDLTLFLPLFKRFDPSGIIREPFQFFLLLFTRGICKSGNLCEKIQLSSLFLSTLFLS